MIDSQKQEIQDKVVSIVNELLAQRAIIENTNTIRLNLDKESNLALKEEKLREILHDECNLYYGKLRHVPKLGNTNRSLYLR